MTKFYLPKFNIVKPTSSLCRFVAVLLMSLSVFSYAQADTWDGTFDRPAAGATAPNALKPNLVSYFSGLGTEDSPYIIDSAKKFATFGYLCAYVFTGNGNHYGYFKLTTDIDLNSIEWIFGESKGRQLQAVFDGGGHTISNLKLVASAANDAGDGSQYSGNRQYGLFIGARGNSSVRAVAKNFTLLDPSLTIESATNAEHFYSLVVGKADHYGAVENVKIENPTVTIKCNHESKWYMGLALGYAGNDRNSFHVKNVVVKNPVVTSDPGLKFKTQNTPLFFGGVAGYLYRATQDPALMHTVDNCSVINANINLSSFTPATEGNLYRNLFIVGGVVGVNVNPHKHSENLYFSGKINAPYAEVAPCVASVQDNNLDWNHYINYSGGETEDNTDEVERSVSSSWSYGDYKIGLTSELATPTQDGSSDNYYIGSGSTKRYVNYKVSDVETIDETKYIAADKLLHHNRYGAHARRSSTVLWWTRSDNLGSNTYASVAPANASDWKNGEQNIFPQRNKNVATYPSYYMYYEQGVNRGTKHLPSDVSSEYETAIERNVENLMGKTSAEDLILTIDDANKDARGFVKHTFSVEAKDAAGNDVSGLTYQWYVDGVAKGTSNTQAVTPAFKIGQGYQDGTNIIVVAKKAGVPVAQATSYIPVVRLRFEGSDTAGTKTDGVHTYVKEAGTKEHPYLLGCEDDLRLLSEHIKQPGNMRQEKLYISGLNNGSACSYRSSIDNTATDGWVGYGQAYYKLDSNINFSEDGDNSPFEPIGSNGTVPFSTDGTYGNYNNNFAFVGSVDGKGFTISNLRETWYAGYANNGAVSAWGLFSGIGTTGQYYKVGEATATKAAVRNLIIDGAVFTHDTANSSFYYPGTNASATSGNANNCSIGPLAGVAGNYSIIENISVTNTRITDEGSSDYYKLANRRLSIGGVIGRATASVNSDNSTLDNATLRYLSSDADINIQHAEFSNVSDAAQTQQFNIGGIVGSIYSNAAANTVPYPVPSVYTGKVRARNAIVGPTFGYVAWNGNSNKGYLDFARHFMAKTSASATFDATGMFYSGFQIYDGTEYKDITDTYPSVTSDWGDRNIKGVSTHANSNVYTESPKKDLYEYQGVNWGNYEILNSPAVTEAFSYDALTTEEKAALEDYTWGWSAGKFTIGASGLSVYAKDTYNGGTVTEHVLEGVITTASTEAKSYQWYERKRVGGTNRDVAIGEDSPTYTADQSVHNRYIYLQGTVGESSENSAVIMVPRNQDIVASIDKSRSAGAWTMSVDLTTTTGEFADAAALTDEGFNISYQWYKGQVGSGTILTGETNSTLSVTTEETTLRYCIVTITDGTVHSDYADDNINKYQFTLSKLPANTMVVYLDPSGSGNDSNTGLDKEHPVKSWHKAYSLLSDGGTWDDNIIVLMSESDGDRTIEGFRLDKSLEAQYTEGSYEAWYNRTYNGTDAYWPAPGGIPEGYATGMSNSHLWKNATITGKWDDITYGDAKITFRSDRDFIGLNGDTKFKNLTFRGHAKDRDGSSYDIFFCQYHNVEFGDSLKMEYVYADGSYGHMAGSNTPDFEVFGGFNGDARFRDDDNGFLGNEWDKYFPHGKEGFTMTFKSGHFGVVCASHRQAYWTAQGMSGTPNMPVKCKIVVDMDRTWNDTYKSCIGTGNGTNADYDIGLILAGNHEGAMYGDVDINVYSGSVARIANGTLGALRQWYGYAGICQPGNAYFGRANALLDPSLSRFATPGETSAEKNERIIITEIYGGGLGRDLGATGMIFIPFYGKSSVTMNGGTFKLLPEGNTHDKEGEVFPGIFATGAGGVNGMYHYDDPIEIDPDHADNPQVYPSSQRLPYWATDKGNGVVWGGNGTTGGLVRYGNWSTYKTHNSATDPQKVYVHCYNADTDDFTDLDPEDSQATVTINDGIFGTSTKPIDGIYGGGSGYTPTYILKNSTSAYPNHRSGNIYGKEGADHPVATLTINGGEFYCKNGIFAGGRGTDHYYKTNRTNSGTEEIDSKPNGAWYGNYTGLGQIYGDVELNITGGTFHDNGSTYFGNIFGGGLGFGDVKYNNNDATKKTLKDMARIYGTTTMNISGGTFEGNIYGGGAIANVGYGTSSRENKHYSIGNKNAVTMNITGGRIAGKVFGAAMGKTNVEVTEAPDSIGNVFGNVNLVIAGDSIGSDIYGGAEKGDVYGNVTANISNVAIGGDIYGGGMGMLSGETITASADVRGSTNVTLGTGAYYIKEVGGDNHFERDYTTPHYIYGGGKDASLIGTYDSTDGSSVTSVTSGGNTTVNINNGMGTEQLTVYGAGYGAKTYCNMTNININNFSRTRDVPVNVDPKWANVGLREVFGGGNEGTVFTSTNVGMKGGQVFGTVFGGGNLAPVGTLSPSSYPYGDFGTMVSLASTDAIIWGDIFGGGNKADVNGTSQVSVSQGAFAGQVFGGGKGEMYYDNTVGYDDNKVGTPANVNGQSVVYVNGANVQWRKRWLSLFGEVGEESEKGTFKEWSGAISGANNGWFIDKSDPGKPVFINPHNIFGGGYIACVVSDTAKVVVTNGAVPSELIKLDVWKNSFRDDANPHFYVFGAGYGPFTQVKATDVTVGVEGYYSEDEDESTNEQWSLDVDFSEANSTTAVNQDGGDMGIYGNGYGIGGYTVLGVIGGGYAGLVKEDTNVKLGGTTFVHRVYGGGYGHLGEYEKLTTNPDLTSEENLPGSIIPAGKRKANLGEVGGDTKVLVSLSKPDENGRTGGVYGDVFGGGAGVESTLSADYPDMGQVLHTTRVDIVENARVYGNVYGGGDVGNIANVASADSVTVVKVRGGDVFGSVFGGGKGRIAAKANDYTTLGNVAGNSYVIVRDSLNSEGEIISPNVWADIYGGGEVGNVNMAPNATGGNADVVVEGGNIGGDIFGAGLGDIDNLGNRSSADIAGNTVIKINGGSFLWDKTAGLDGNVKSLIDIDIERETAMAMVEARKRGENSAELTALTNNYADIFSLSDNLFLKDHNIYGGGNNVSTVAGNATITVNHGLITDEVSYFDDRTWKLSTVLKQLCTGNNSHPQFSVLGGGYGINTTITGNTLVNVQVGKDTDGNPETIDYPNQTADRQTWSDLYNAFTTEYSALPDDVKDEYYGGTSGSNGLARYQTSRLANIFRIPNHTFMNIVGGGMAGLVRGNATVNLYDQSVCQNVFGGGIGIMPASPVGTETYGQVLGRAEVNISGGIVKGNVYGGGAGMESYDNNGTYIDFPEMGAVGKTTKVEIDGTPTGTIVFGKVFGGGDIADVKNTETATPASEVMIKGGCVYQEIFAGGSGSLDSEANDYRNLGKVTGNTKVTIQDNATPANSPWIWNRIYGGGSYGSVTGNTTVDIQGGHLGYNIFGAGFGDVRTLADGTESITSSDVGGDTNVNVSGGEWCLSQMWDIENRNWIPKITNDVSAQFDKEAKKFLVNHNIYGGGNAASNIVGNANINITKGLLKGDTNLGHDDAGRTETSLFNSVEWREVYNKIGSFHFSVIGGGYGENTSVGGNTIVDVNIPAASADKEISADFIEKSADVLKDDMYTLFRSEQAIMDIIGGGYNGRVNGDTHVTISGDPYIRRIFGGSFYADVNNTNIQINSACADYIFAGGMMGNVNGNTNLTIGNDGADNNRKILLCDDIYGGNDVSGQVNGQINVNILGGKIYHNVYGAGNGNYLYALNEERTKVAAVEDYEVDGAVYPLVYEVPRRQVLMPASAESSSEAARLVNINSYRPLSQFINLNIKAASSSPVISGDATARIKILGKVFGGGNTATVTKLDGISDPRVRVNIGNYVNIKEVFMGADGEAMFDESTSGFLNAFKRINDIVLSDGINWANDPYNKAIPETYLPLSLDERQRTFPHIIDLYFQPVEMSVQPVLKWNDVVASHDSNPTITGTTIGSFFCGGNRGNMDVAAGDNGKVVDYLFPEGLTITDKIVGGCNNANFTRTDLGVVHEGGYLLGKRSTTDPSVLTEPTIRLTVKANMQPTEKEGKYYGANVYGGCYKSGSIHGDVKVDMYSNIINGLDVDKLAASNADKDVTVGSVYGAGYGTDSYVYGDIKVSLGSSATAHSQEITTSVSPDALNASFENGGNVTQSLPGAQLNEATAVTKTYNDAGASVNNLYGGGELGNVIGNTTVQVLNGHVVTDVVGGSYSGTQYGSTQVLVGYPQYYTVNNNESGIYSLKRADDSDNLAIENYDGSKAIKTEVHLMAGDIVSPVVRDAIAAYDGAHSTSQAGKLTVHNPAPDNWNNVSITIGEAVYGGGYALSSGYTGTGGAGTYTVKKYTDAYNVDNSMTSSDPLYNNPTRGYGGNTTVMVWDNPEAATEHITISSESADGGFYGDGHLSYAEGFRSGELKGYGYAQHTVLDKAAYEAKEDPEGEDDESNWKKVEVDKAKMMNTIQRLDLMRLTDNCLILNGARDYTVNEVSTTPYSIARVGELQMVSTIDSTATTPFPTVAKARNYVGLMNNIHYVGAIKSSVDFDRKFHDYTGAVDGEANTYRQKKQKYITDFYTAYPAGKKSASEISKLTTEQQAAYNLAWETFNKRNDATSLNMIGLSSGYALKIQGTRVADNVGTEELFYGPVDGIVEMKLIQPIADEGGGYVYADNVHDDQAEFLESTGNFVFPTSLLGAQRVVDDCLLTSFDKLEGTYGSTKDAHQSEMHYWFLTGRHYFYNLHITGYTYDSNGFTDDQYVANDIKGIKFNADTSDGLTILEGASNNLVLTGVKWNHHHQDDGTADTDYNDLCDIEKATGYTLRLSASNTERNSKTYTYYNQDEGTSLFYDISPDMNIDNGDKEPELPGGYENPAFTKQTLNMTKSGSVVPNGTEDSSPAIGSPLLSLQLVDNVNNGVANSEGLSASEYYNKHLSRPDTIQIELRSKPEQWNTYTINLIINYVKGPSYTGNLEVANCALPGEYIKIRKDGITIDADETFAQNGEFLRIGKRTYNTETGKWSLDEGYLTYDASGENTSAALKGKVYSDPAGKYLMIPAYYFMNGYGVQYVFTCNNMNGIPFPVDMREADKLLVHNYHQMKPRATFDMDLHLAEAVTRASVEDTFAEPRIYIKDVKDLQAMQQFVDTIGVSENPVYNKVNYDGVERDVPANGAYAQFFLQNNITVQQTTPLAVDSYYKTAASFAGTLNADGYSVTGVDGNLFTNLSATGNVYNLGMETGGIAGTVAEGGKIHTSYEYANHIVYDANGNANGNYSEEEFNNGTVAYNLNQYYLEARKYILAEVKAGRSTPTSSAIAEQSAVEYVKNYYANGDYQYARITSDGSEYLRNNANPHYYVDISTGFDTYATWHDTTHAIDAARKVDVSTPNSLWVGVSEEVSGSSQMSLGASFADNAVTSVAPGDAIYKPLFNEARIDATSGATAVKNDYIFFGQGLQVVPEDHPVKIASHDVANMTNRVWRASGFYQTKEDRGFHFNASGDANRIITYVNDAKTTAIDFTGKRDEQNAASLPSTGMLEANSQKIFYAPALDLPAEYYGLRMADGVTKNLLVYTDNQTAADGKIAKIAATLLNYGDDTDEIDIKGHRVEGTGSPLTYTAAKLHLVDLEDFNAPIQFTATKAWYERDPQTETGYVNDAGKAWSSICLPYTVQTATLSDGIQRYQDAYGNGAVGPQSSITFFYGSDDKASSDKAHTILNHEFWLRGLNPDRGVSGGKAYFKRPAYSIDGKSEDNDAANETNRGFAAYKPFIVSFPGSRFYEFNMEGQTITFGAAAATIDVTDNNIESSKTTANGYTYYGAFLNNEGTGVYAIDINGVGDKFEAGKAVYPFRAYLTNGSALTPNSMDAGFTADGFILIGDDLSKLEDVMDGDIERDPDGGVSTPSGLHVYGVGQRLVVVSDFATTLPVYTVTGALVRVLDVRPGTATYSGFKQGVYVVDRKKIRLR